MRNQCLIHSNMRSPLCITLFAAGNARPCNHYDNSPASWALTFGGAPVAVSACTCDTSTGQLILMFTAPTVARRDILSLTGPGEGTAFAIPVQLYPADISGTRSTCEATSDLTKGEAGRPIIVDITAKVRVTERGWKGDSGWSTRCIGCGRVAMRELARVEI